MTVLKDTKTPIEIGMMAYIDSLQAFGRVIHKTYSGHYGFYMVDVQKIDDGSIIDYIPEKLIARVIFEQPDMKFILRRIK